MSLTSGYVSALGLDQSFGKRLRNLAEVSLVGDLTVGPSKYEYLRSNVGDLMEVGFAKFGYFCSKVGDFIGFVKIGILVVAPMTLTFS